MRTENSRPMRDLPWKPWGTHYAGEEQYADPLTAPLALGLAPSIIGFTPQEGRTLIFDCETNGLLTETREKDGTVRPPMDRIHCLAAHDPDTGESWDFEPGRIEEGIRFLMTAGTLIGHNIIDFDLRAISKCYPWFYTRARILDTLVLCKRLWPADVLIGPDMKRFQAGQLPAKYIKRQSLGAWGYRLGELKAEYDGGWDEWSPVMHDYLKQDVVANAALWKRIKQRLGWDPEHPTDYVWPMLPVEIEMGAAAIMAEQESIGYGLNREKAQALAAELMNRQAVLGDKLREAFGSWWQPLDNPTKGRTPTKDRKVKLHQFPDVTISRGVGKSGKPLKPYVGPPLEYYTAGAPYCRVEWVTFSPTSRTQLADRLQRVYNWTPTTFTPKGQAQVDEGAIKAIPKGVISEDLRSTILEFFVVTKTLGALSTGNKSWMDAVKADGCVHHRCDTLGTITGRGAHMNPNLAQVPSVSVKEVRSDDGLRVVSKSPILGAEGGYGWECRDLFQPGNRGWEQTGTDMASLEFVLLGHDLHPLDEGVFSDRVCDPERDAHEEHGQLTGLGRQDTKTVGYAYIFGAGDWKLGFQVGVKDEEIPTLLKSKSLGAKLRFQKRIMGTAYQEPSDLDKAYIAKGSVVKKKFEGAITGLKFLKENISETAKARGWIKDLAGAKVIIRKPHAALNSRLQGGGASVCKLWLILTHKGMGERGYRLRWDWNQMAWVHDEQQNEHRPGLGPVLKEVTEHAAKETGRILKLRGTFRTESKTGSSWAHCH